MAKKKVEVSLDRSPMKDEPLTGDVVIDYGNNTIYATRETNEIHLLTQNKVCLHEIVLDYHKPEPKPIGAAINIHDTTTNTHELGSLRNPCVIEVTDGYSISDLMNGDYIIPSYLEGMYSINAYVACSSDMLGVTLNGVPIEYNSREEAYICELSSNTYPTEFNLVITNKR